MLSTGLCLSVSAFEGILDRPTAKAWHLWSGIALAAGLVLITLLGNRRSLLRSARELDRFDADDGRWLKGAPGRLVRGGTAPPQGRFNAGQKLNAALIGGLMLAMYVTGFLLWYGERDTTYRFAGHGDRARLGHAVPDAAGRRPPLPRGAAPRHAARPARHDARRRRRGLGAQAPREVGRTAPRRRPRGIIGVRREIFAPDPDVCTSSTVGAMSERFRRMFPGRLPVIAMAHVPALPGSPLYDSGAGVQGAIDDVRRDLEILLDEGVDAVLF